ncbi:MAG TPA: hypothetical protein PLY68_00405 [Myxococcota bacterium]|mgnify:CR=1 FL=1|nr:class I SAM-dependent RNA methyltransferase [Myxococcota bacterium]HNZ02757.1 hypothetical protein [Myxococcota bacterium]HOD08311.1 hypothetical protein [Myxococcota bacterium]HPB50819.1 hypothetical protein [Myxococcota bacterium]HQP94638.1 hypothetical protein [Myxococcota bacterium]
MPDKIDKSLNETHATIRIVSPGHLGRGIGRLDNKVCMVPYTVPGDLVTIRTIKDHGSWLEAAIVEILEPGPGRVEPACPVYGRCGGCQLRHIDDERRATWKTAVFRDLLKRIGHVEVPDIEFLPAAIDDWRCRMTLHVDAATGRTGFFEAASHSVVSPGACPIAMEPLHSLMTPVCNEAGKHCRESAEIELVTGDDGRCVSVVDAGRGDPSRLADALSRMEGITGVMSKGRQGRWRETGDKTIQWPTAGLPGATARIPVDPRGFTQAHLTMNKALVEKVLEHAGAPLESRRVVELYAGAGNITVPLALRGATVFATDINEPAIGSASVTMKRLGRTVVHTAGRVSQVLKRLPAGFVRPDLLIADPPRLGMERDAAAVAGLGAARVVLCSCEPSTLARDIIEFQRAGYRLERASIVDMFPSTYHMEAVISLTF